MATEKLNFEIQLYSTFHKNAPTANIKIDGRQYFQGEIRGTRENPDIIKFTHECDNDADNRFALLRDNKSKYDTIVEDGKIIKDQILHIKTLSIDDIDVEPIILEADFTPFYDGKWYKQELAEGRTPPKKIKQIRDLGYNGVWDFHFRTPFYQWLLENLY